LEFERRWPRAQLITKTDLAKAWNAWGQHPEVVSLGGQKNFKHFMATLDDQVRRPTLDEDEYRRVVGKVIVFRDTSRLVNELKSSIPAYRANVAAYVVSYFSFRVTGALDFNRIWDKQGVAEAVKDVLRSWALPIYQQIVKTSGARNVSEWCKKADCWLAVRALNLGTDVELTRFVSSIRETSPTGLLDSGDAAAISECLRMTPDDWERLVDWAMGAPVHPSSRGVASTLRLYALGNWDRKPSVKQARAALRLIKKWRNQGIENDK
jgi:hypothetical protein